MSDAQAVLQAGVDSRNAIAQEKTKRARAAATAAGRAAKGARQVLEEHASAAEELVKQMEPLRARLGVLSSMEEPTSESLVDEAATRRRLERLEKQHSEAVSALSTARESSLSVMATLAQAEEELRCAALDEESIEIEGEALLFDGRFRERLAAHLEKLGSHQTRVGRLAVWSSDALGLCVSSRKTYDASEDRRRRDEAQQATAS